MDYLSLNINITMTKPSYSNQNSLCSYMAFMVAQVCYEYLKGENCI